MTQQYLFVYGTLRRELNHRMYQLLTQQSDSCGMATFQGKLFRISFYPGVIPSENPQDRVIGEVYQLRDAAKVLPQLDQFEQCGEGYPEPTEYVRELHKVTLENGSSVSAWIYIYNRATQNLLQIGSGDFLEQN